MGFITNEYLRIFKSLNLFKVHNYLMIIAGYWLSLLTKRNISPGLPYAFSYEPTNICNLKCPECPSGQNNLNREKGYANIVDFKKLIVNIKKHCFYLNLYFQGEPFLNKNLSKMIAYAVKNKIFTAVSTNGHFIDENTATNIINAGLGRLIISLDGASQESYEQYRKGGDFNKVISGIKIIINTRKKLKANNPIVVIQCLALSSTEYEIQKIKDLANELGVDKIEIKTAQFYNLIDKNFLMPSQNKYSRYKKTSSGKSIIKNKLANKCFLLWSSSVITWDGYVVPCCFDKDAKYSYGNINNMSFKSIWKNSNAKKFRKQILKNRADVDICCNCNQGLNL